MSDLISRQAAIDAIDSVFIDDESYKVWFKLAVKNLPSAQPKQKTGKLVNDPIDKQDMTEEVVKEWCEKRCLIVLTTEHYHELNRRITSLELELMKRYHNLNQGEKVGNWELKL